MKILKNIFSITNQLISTQLAQKFSDEQIKLQKHFHEYSFASYLQI